MRAMWIATTTTCATQMPMAGNDNSNSEAMAVRPIASTNCGYISNAYIRDNVETIYVL